MNFLDGLLGMDEDPRKAAQRAGLLGMGATLLQAGGPSLQPTSLGQALGAGVMTGRGMAQQAYQQAGQAQADRAMQEMLGEAGGSTDPEVYRKLAMMPGIDPARANLYLRMAEQAAGKAENLGGDAANIARTMFGTADVRNLSPEQRQQVMQMAQQQQMSAARAGAPSLSVQLGNTLATEAVKAQVPLIQESYKGAKGAANTLQTLGNLEGVIDNVFAGPGSTVQTALARFGQALGFGGSNQQETLNNTVAAMQGFAQLTLDAAPQITGVLSDSDIILLGRARSGDITTMNTGELKTLLNIFKKSSQAQIDAHNELVGNVANMAGEQGAMFNTFKIKPPKRMIYNEKTGQLEER